MRNSAERLAVFLLILSTSFFYLVPISIWNSVKIMSLLIIIFLVFNLRCLFKNKGKFTLYIASFIFLCIGELIITKLRFNQGYISLFSMGIYYFVIMLYFILVFYKVSRDKIKKVFINLSLILSILLIAQFIAYEFFGVTFLKIDVGGIQRFGQVRIGEGAFIISLGIILAVAEVIKRKEILCRENTINFLSIILGMIDIIFIAKTRSILAFVLLSIGVMMLGSAKNFIQQLKIVSLSTIALIVLFSLPIMSKYQSLNSEKDWSTIARKGAIAYYINQTKEMPLFGVGIINPSESKEMYDYTRGPLGIYYRDDVGIIGFLNTFGVIGFIWYIALVIKILAIVFKSIINKSIRKRPQIIGLATFFIVCSSTVIFMDPQRIYLLPFILYIIEE